MNKNCNCHLYNRFIFALNVRLIIYSESVNFGRHIICNILQTVFS